MPPVACAVSGPLTELGSPASRTDREAIVERFRQRGADRESLERPAPLLNDRQLVVFPSLGGRMLSHGGYRVPQSTQVIGNRLVGSACRQEEMGIIGFARATGRRLIHHEITTA
jgi:hypothetical protein